MASGMMTGKGLRLAIKRHDTFNNVQGPIPERAEVRSQAHKFRKQVRIDDDAQVLRRPVSNPRPPRISRCDWRSWPWASAGRDRAERTEATPMSCGRPRGRR
jgi:hypothetical protein